ncbi:Uncharacterised protein [Mycobacteroides abscessus subsp. abscessus]|nr:Uncharacterised protein [Mycobacteroides abscessus subsp. abscessus]SLD04728.1 Uncharacterised protein [Mycobacteroides abscessus subsp. abscessus]
MARRHRHFGVAHAQLACQVLPFAASVGALSFPLASRRIAPEFASRAASSPDRPASGTARPSVHFSGALELPEILARAVDSGLVA